MRMGKLKWDPSMRSGREFSSLSDTAGGLVSVESQHHLNEGELD